MCKDCTRGQFKKDDDTCEACAKGQFQDILASAACKACVAGTYQNSGGQLSCKDCETGRYQMSTAATDCVDCGAGRFNGDPARAQDCQACTQGKFQQHVGKTQCTQCSKGTYGAPNTARDTEATHCLTCAKGQFQDATGKIECTPWKTCVDGQNELTAGSAFEDRSCGLAHCPKGWWGANPQSLDDCQECASAVACPVGHFQDDAASTCACIACPAGQYAMIEGAVGQCKLCPAGTHQSEPGKPNCKYCPAGTKSAATGATSHTTCTPCSYGSFSAQGQHVCSECPGNANANGATCRAGTYRKNTQIDCACTNCPAGEHNPGAATSATEGSTSCTKCLINTYASDVGPNTACTDCAPGKHAPNAGSAYCRACPVGHAFKAATKTCAPCLAGHFQNVAGQTACKKCPCGKSQDKMGQTHCNACAHGTGTATEGSISCAAGTSSCGATAAVPALPTLTFANVADVEGLTPAEAMAGMEDMVIFGQQAQDFAARTEQQLTDLRTTGAPLTDASAAHEGYVSLDIDGNGAVDYSDAMSFFVSTTMRGYGATTLIGAYRTKHPSQDAPTRTVDQIMALTQEAATATTLGQPNANANILRGGNTNTD
jgi:hypothetical protein